jgi:hypothetical protein
VKYREKQAVEKDIHKNLELLAACEAERAELELLEVCKIVSQQTCRKYIKCGVTNSIVVSEATKQA